MTKRLSEAEWALLKPGDAVALHSYGEVSLAFVHLLTGKGTLVVRPDLRTSPPHTVKRLGRDRYLVTMSDDFQAAWARNKRLATLKAWAAGLPFRLGRQPDEVLDQLEATMKIMRP